MIHPFQGHWTLPTRCCRSTSTATLHSIRKIVLLAGPPRTTPVHVATSWVSSPILAGGEKWELVVGLLSQHSVMFNHIGSRRGSAPPPYSSGPSLSLPSPARRLYHRNHVHGHAAPPNTPDHRQYEFEPGPPSHSEGARHRRGAIPPYGIGGSNDLKRPSKVFPDHRPSVGSTFYDPPGKDPSYSPPLDESHPGGIDRFKDEDEINFNILRQ
jgi:hypothetical protein